MAASADRFFIVYQNPDLWPAYADLSLDDEAFTQSLWNALTGRSDLTRSGNLGFEVVDRPSLRVLAPRIEALAPLQRDPEQPMVIALVFHSSRDRERFASVFKPKPIHFAGIVFPPGGIFADMPMSFAQMPPFQHCCPGSSAPSLFGNRSDAERLIRAQALRTPAYQAKAKAGVNVIVVDQGIDGRRFPAANPANGWTINGIAPFTATGRHGAMIARNVLDLAPTATLFDCPLLPDRIAALPAFLSLGAAAYINILITIFVLRVIGPPRSWVISNAWGVYDVRLDQPPGSSANYGQNPHHYFNALVSLCQTLDADVVFAAGNCGEFCPDDRCGPDNIGPGRSIFGANGLDKVLTVGAVRFDATWLGYSAQGPGVPAMQPHKPDVCAPSQFQEPNDASHDGANTGTSAACGVAAGLLAALRTRWTPAKVGPAALRQALRQSAFLPVTHPDGKLRFGAGIVDAAQVQTLLPP